MKITQDIREQAAKAEGMAAKSKEFADLGGTVYVPV